MKKLILWAILLLASPLVTHAQLLPRQDELMLDGMLKEIRIYCDSAHHIVMKSIPVGDGVEIHLFESTSKEKRRLVADMFFVRAGNSWTSGATDAQQIAFLKKIRILAKKPCH